VGEVLGVLAVVQALDVVAVGSAGTCSDGLTLVAR
jgi:hypothetical protein